VKSIYVGMVALVILVIAIFSSSPAGAYVDKTRSEALAYCESGIVWEQENMPGDWVFHGSCKDQPYDGDYPDYLGCYALWGNFDIPDEGVYGEDYEILDSCYGIDDDPAGKNVGPAGGCDGGEGGCPAGPADAGAPTAGDPVNTATGNKYVEEPDYTDDPWLTFRRFYNSDPAASSSAIGVRWSHSFNRRLDRTLLFNGASTITVYRPTGLRELFHKNGTAGWTASSDNPDILTESVDTEGNTTGYALWIAAIRHTETYAADGRLLSIKDNTGQIATLTYSDSSTPRAVAPQSNLLLSVTAPSGRTLSFIYDESSRIHQITLPDGNVLTYDYDHPGNLSVVTYPDGHQRQYVYNEQSLTGGTNLPAVMTGMIDENGVRLETTSYDENGRATSTESAGGAGRIAIRYNADGSSDVTYPLGGVSHRGYTKVLGLMRIANLDKPCGECGLRYGSRTYDANGYPATVTDFLGRVSNRTYDANGLLTQQVDGQGSSDQRTIDTTWNAALRVPLLRTVKDASGALLRKEGWAYNASGQVTAQCLIDPIKAPSYTCAASGTAPAGVRRTVNTYCTTVSSTCPLLGLLLTVDGPRTDVTDTLTYAWYQQTDESGCGTLGGSCHHAGDLKTVTGGAGLVTTYVSYDKAGRLTRQKAPNGVLTDYTYTSRGWLATTTVRAQASGAPSASDATTTVGYNPDGTVHQVTDPDGVVTTYTYDAAHRLTDVTDGQGHRYHYTLDQAGNRLREDVLTAEGTVVKSTSRTFNTLGQLTAITDGLNRAVFSAAYTDSYDGNGNLVHSSDGLGIQRKQAFDGLDRLVSTLRNYQGADTSTANSQEVTSFDALDRVTGFSDPDELNTTYDFDALNNPTATHSPDTGLTARTFDIAGNVVTSTDATNNSRVLTYDANNRPVTATFADTTLNIQYKYDEADTTTGCTGSYGKGHLTRIIEGNGGITWCYDAFGRVVRKVQVLGTASRTTVYAWTRAGRLSSLTTPNGTAIAYTRDSIGNVTSISATPKNGTATAVVSNIVYKPFGPVASYELGSGQTVTYTYDLTGAVTDVVGGPLAQHLKRDALGNITVIGDTAGVATPTETYSYDSLYRLTGAKAPSGTSIEAYTYNKTGDRLTKAAPGVLTGTYTYATGTHHLTGVGTTTRVVDARGNTTSDVLASGAFSYGYNQRNRLTVVRKDGVTVGTYVVNALGQRIQKTASGVTTSFDYTEDSQLIGEATAATSRDYIWLGSIPIAVVDGTGTAATISYVVADGLGTPRAVVDATGATKWQWAYASNPFGERAPTSSNGYVLNLRYAGQYFDAESGLIHNGFRDYEAATGRYLQSDPAGLAGGTTTYGYVGGSPLLRIDRLGLQSFEGPPEENLPENIPEVNEELDRLDEEAREGFPPPGEATPPRPDTGEWGPNGECVRPELRSPEANISPTLDPSHFAGRSPAEIDSLARSHGLIPRGRDPMNGIGSYIDPITGAQRILSHGNDPEPHMHVNDSNGQRLDINGNPVHPNDPAAHLPIGTP